MSTDRTYEIELVSFHDDQIEAIRGQDGEHYVVPKRICENIGLDWAGQYTKLKSARWARIEMIPIHDSSGRQQETQVIPLKAVPMWLAGINSKKVGPAIRAKIERYQDEASEVLARHFLGKPVLAFPGLAELNSKLDGVILEVHKIAMRSEPTRRRTGRPLSAVPHGYYRIALWAKARGISLDAGGEVKAEAQRCVDISADYVLPVYSCQLPGEKYPANAYHELALRRWLKGFCNRHRLQVTGDLGFGSDYVA